MQRVLILGTCRNHMLDEPALVELPAVLEHVGGERDGYPVRRRLD
jgi:hypothetical protein